MRLSFKSNSSKSTKNCKEYKFCKSSILLCLKFNRLIVVNNSNSLISLIKLKLASKTSSLVKQTSPIKALH